MLNKFSLQPVLDYRHNRVEMLEVQLGQLFGAQHRVMENLKTLEKEQLDLHKELAERQTGEMDLVRVAQLRANLKSIGKHIERHQANLVELERQIQGKRAEVVGAKQDEEILCTLKDKQIERYLAEEAYQELRLQDDIYIAQAHRRT